MYGPTCLLPLSVSLEISRVSWYILENFVLHGPEQPFNLMTDEKTEAQRKGTQLVGSRAKVPASPGLFFWPASLSFEPRWSSCITKARKVPSLNAVLSHLQIG